MKTVCEKNMCAGCMACVNICHKKAIKIQDNLSAYNAVIDESECVNCNACHDVCPKNNIPNLKKPIECYLGWATDSNIRNNAASGGIATAISKSFLDNSGVVYGCSFDEGHFNFVKVTNESEIEKLRGSKYVKSNTEIVFSSIKNDLANGTSVLFIGLPCQVAGLKRFIGKNSDQRLYTIDLVCHGTPSPKVLELFLGDNNKSLESIKSISFRTNNKRQIWVDGEGIATKGVSDKYTIAFINGLTLTENCYKCDFAKTERVSDITLGDSFGDELIEEKREGLSLVLCQTNKAKDLIQKADVELKKVDLDKAIINNHQLKAPSDMAKNRTAFFESIEKGKRINREVLKRFPKECLKQNIKSILIKLKIVNG